MGLNMNRCCASIYALPELNYRISKRDLWQNMSRSLLEEFPEDYSYSPSWYLKICFCNEYDFSPDRKFVRYRTLEADIRRREGKKTLLDLSVGNMFSEAPPSRPDAVNLYHEPSYSKWVHRAGKISLNEHLRLITKFKADLMDSGWSIAHADFRVHHFEPPTVKTSRGVRPMPVEQLSSLAQGIINNIDGLLDFGVVSPNRAVNSSICDNLSRELQSLLGNRTRKTYVHTLSKPSSSCINLIVLPDDFDLRLMPDIRDNLRLLESSDIRFKLAKWSTLSKKYPTRNIAYDMIQLGGGIFWENDNPQPSFCSIDAGHDRDHRKSRWVKVETNQHQKIELVKVFDTQLAEHLPDNLLEEMWPSKLDSIFCRDGRLARERHQFQARAKIEHRHIIEAKKSPKSIIWRSTRNGVSSGIFGDALIDEHGDVLLQTMPQNINDYLHPIRLTCHGDHTLETARAFLHQQAIPGLSQFKMSRLPGSIYYADLISKLTIDGWPKSIGRGFRIPQIIP
jgi:hypothetical protein